MTPEMLERFGEMLWWWREVDLPKLMEER